MAPVPRSIKPALPPKYEDLEALILGLIEDAESFTEDELSSHRERTWKFYNGKVDTPHKKGRSKVVKTEVRDTVELLMPSLMALLLSSVNMVEFTVTRQYGDPAEAAAATEEINNIFFNDNNGWLLTHDTVKESLIARSGAFKVYEEEYTEYSEEYVDAADELGLELAQMAGAEVSDMEDDTLEDIGASFPDEISMVKVMMPQKYKKICVELVPAEELIIDRRAREADKATIIGQRSKVRLGDLVAMGFPPDMVEDFRDAEEDEPEQEEQARTGYNQSSKQTIAETTEHWALREVTVKEIYPLLDPDQTGVLARHQCFVVNDQILRVKKVKLQPYVLFSSIRIPHTAIGRSPGENSAEFQEIGTGIYRQLMDNLYWSNNPALEVVRNAANPYQVEQWGFGQIIDVKAAGSVNPLVIPFVGDKAIMVMDWMERQREARTGGFKDALGLNPKVLRGQTATAAEGAQSQATRQLEMYARVIAETGIAMLYRKLYEVRYGRKPNYGMKINVGLGNGTTEERLQALMLIASKQEQVLLSPLGLDNGIVKLEQYGYTLNKLAELVPYYDSSQMFNSPDQIAAFWGQKKAEQAQQGPPPDPAMAEVEGKLQIAQQKAQTDAQAKQAKAQADQQMQQVDAQAKMAETQAKIRATVEKAQAEIALLRQKAEAEMGLAVRKQQAELALEQQELEYETRLEAAKIATGERSGQGNIPRERQGNA